MAQKEQSTKHWSVLVCVSFMFAASAGIINNVIGVFYTPVSESLGVLRGTFALHSTITMVLVGVISLITPKLIHRFGWKLILTIGVIFAFIGTAGMAFTDELLVFYLLGAIRGIGAGLFGLVPMAMLINNWFHMKNGLAISLASAFSGLIGMIFAPIMASVIAYFGWQNGFIAMGTAIVLLALPAIIYPYSLLPQQENLVPYGYEMNVTIKSSKTKETSRPSSNSKSIYISFFAMIIFSVLHTNILGMNQHLSSYGESIGMSLQFSGYMLSAVMLGNILFKLVIGPMSDRVGAIKSTIIMNTVNVISLIILIAWPSAVPSIAAAFLFGSVFCVGSVALPLLSNQFFGKNLSERVFPILTFTSSIGAAFSNTMVGYIFDFTGSYQTAFLIAVVFQAINLVLLFVAYRFSVQKLGHPQSLRS
ncbi:MFS transporter [Desemzia sp. RIT804]|uniref:MFS transporter n=1 Tax=Desemzia sp. RIT 804 TaxID=2810209 RepID=UPI00195272F5|nr:MFS transporter [Desemzia sp. RIT 804]